MIPSFAPFLIAAFPVAVAAVGMLIDAEVRVAVFVTLLVKADVSNTRPVTEEDTASLVCSVAVVSAIPVEVLEGAVISVDGVTVAEGPGMNLLVSMSMLVGTACEGAV